MLFFLKEKPIEITAIVSKEYCVAFETMPIKPARDCFPSWWKNIPPSSFNIDTFNSNTTIKSCPGISQSLQRGFIMSLWSDLAIETEGDSWKWLFSDRMSSADVHPNISSPGFYEDYHKLKLISPWIIKSPVDLFLCSPFYLFNLPTSYITPSGFVQPFLNNCGLNTFLFFKKSEQKMQYLLKFGTPLLHIIPFTDKKVKFKCEIVSDQEFYKSSKSLGTTNRFVTKGLKNIFSKNV